MLKPMKLIEDKITINGFECNKGDILLHDQWDRLYFIVLGTPIQCDAYSEVEECNILVFTKVDREYKEAWVSARYIEPGDQCDVYNTLMANIQNKIDIIREKMENNK